MASRESTQELISGLLKAQKAAKALLSTYDKLTNSIVKSGKEMSTAFKTLDLKSAADIEKLNTLLQQTTVLTKQQTTAKKESAAVSKEKARIDKELTKALIEEERLLQAQIRTKTLLTKEEERLAKAKARELKAKNQLNGAYARESKQLNSLRKQYKDLIITEGKTTKETRKLLKEITALDTKLKSVDKTLGQSQRNVGNYGSAFGKAGNALKSFGAALGITAGITAFVRTLTNAVNIAKDFEQGNANLASVLGTTAKNIKTLTNDAKRLGAETSFSATQVTQLQTEFAKLGFNEQEILNATEATLDLAAATGSDLGEAAAIAGATLGGFGLDAAETARVADVMAKSFSTSALDLEKFKESMKDAAPAAKAVGVDVEKTTALLGTLSNAGISGSKAGTALKAGFIELNAAGVTLDESLEMIANSQDKLATATELVGKRAATSFLVLADGVEVTNELEQGLNNASGAAKKMADEQLDTLTGKTKILNSAWEGLVLSLLSGDSAFSSISKSLIEGTTSLLGFLTPSMELADTWFSQRDAVVSLEESMNPLLQRYDELERQTTLTKDEQEELDGIIQQIATNLPNAITQFDEYGKAMDISTTAARNLIQQQKDLLALDNAEAIKEQVDAISSLETALGRINSRYEVRNGVLLKYSKEIDRFLPADAEDIENYQKRGEEIRKEIETRTAKIAQLKGEKTELELKAEAEAAATETTKESTVANKENTKSLKDQQKELKRIQTLERQLEDLRFSLIADNEQRELAIVEASFNRKIENIQGNSDIEIALRKALEEKKQEELFKIRAKYGDTTTVDGVADPKKKGTAKGGSLSEVIKSENDKAKEALDARKELFEESVEAIDKIFAESYAKREAEIDKDLEKSTDAQLRIQAAIEAGNEDAKASLAAEERREAELERKKEATRKKAQRAEAAIALLKVLGENADQPDALGKTLANYAAILAAIQSAPAFFSGTDDTGKVNNGLDSNGGRMAILHDNEMIFSKQDRVDVGNRTRGQIKDIVNAHDKNLLQDSSIGVLNGSNGGLIVAVKRMEKSIETLHERMPVSTYKFDEVAKQNIETIKYHNKVETVRTRANKSWS